MSKIVCDVCGTSYPETATQCPICGNAKSEKAATSGKPVTQDSGYAYVKGGRFSHSNVRKRNNGKKELPRTVVPAKPEKEKNPPKQPEATPVTQPERRPKPKSDPQSAPQTAPKAEPQQVLAANQPAPKAEPKVEPQKERPIRQSAPQPEAKAEPRQERPSRQPAPEQQERPAVNPRRRQRKTQKNERSSNIGLLIIVVVLIMAILVVCAYIAIRLLDLKSRPTLPEGTTTSQSVPSQTTSTNLPARIPCTDISVIPNSIEFTSANASRLLDFTVLPKDTTDVVTFESSDPYIATVDDKGVVRPIAKGNVTITVSCGGQVAYCEIICNLPNEPAYPTEPPATTTKPAQPTQPSLPAVKLVLRSTDITLNNYGETYMLYNGELDPASITWISGNDKVVTVVNGLVRAVGKGTTKVYAEYGDQRAECIVRCEEVVVSDYELHNQFTGLKPQITMKVGDKIKFFLINRETGEKVDASEVEFSVSNDKYISVDENGVVTAIAKSGSRLVNLVVKYKGVTYKCQIIVA